MALSRNTAYGGWHSRPESWDFVVFHMPKAKVLAIWPNNPPVRRPGHRKAGWYWFSETLALSADVAATDTLYGASVGPFSSSHRAYRAALAWPKAAVFKGRPSRRKRRRRAKGNSTRQGINLAGPRLGDLGQRIAT